jgi:hypothetical protein
MPMERPQITAIHWTASAFRLLILWGPITAVVLLVGPILGVVSNDLENAFAIGSMLLSLVVVFTSPLILIISAWLPYVFFQQARGLPERAVWVVLAGAPLAVCVSVLCGSQWAFRVVMTVLHPSVEPRDLYPYIAGYVAGFLATYMSLLAFALRRRLRIKMT